MRDVVRLGMTCRAARAWVCTTLARNLTPRLLRLLLWSVPTHGYDAYLKYDALPSTVAHYAAGQFSYSNFPGMAVSFIEHLLTPSARESRTSPYTPYCKAHFSTDNDPARWCMFNRTHLQWYPMLDHAILAALRRFDTEARAVEQARNETLVQEMRVAKRARV